jgi:hypothetical protein
VVTGCTGCARFQGKGWSRLELLTLMVRVQTMQTLSRADSPYPEKIPSINCDCTWTAWEMRTQPCITVQKTQQGDLSKSPDINLTEGVIRTFRGHRGPAGVLSTTELRVSLWADAEGVWELFFLQALTVNLGILWFINLFFTTKPL